jgi:hypothetical protein
MEGWYCLIVLERVRPDEAWIQADVDKCTTGTEHTRRLADDGWEVFYVGVREDRDNCVETSVGERQILRVRLDKFDLAANHALFGEPQLVGRNVDPGNAPAQATQRVEVDARAAAQVEAVAFAAPE